MDPRLRGDDRVGETMTEAAISLSYVNDTTMHNNTLKIVNGGTGVCYLDLIKLLPSDQPC